MHTTLVAKSYYFDKNIAFGIRVHSKKHLGERALCIDVDSTVKYYPLFLSVSQ